MKTSQSPTTWRVGLQAWLALFGLGIALWLTMMYAHVILEVVWVLFGAYLLSLAIRPLADWGEQRHLSRGITVILVYAAMIGLLVIIGSLLVPVVTAEVSKLQTNGPNLLQGGLNQLSNNRLTQWIPSYDTLVQGITQRLDTLLAGALGTVAGIGSLTIDLLVAFILTYFFVVEVGWGSRLVLGWFPTEQHQRIEQILQNIRHDLRRWTLAQLGIGLYFATTFSVGLGLLGVPFALTIGLISGLLGFIPYVGSIIATIFAILSALTVQPILALWVLIFTSVVSSIEVHLLAPVLYGRAIGLRSAVVLVALLVGAKMQGIVGIIFAVPVAAVLATIISELQKTMLNHE